MAQLILLLLPVPRSIMMCLFLKPQVVIIYNEQMYVRPEEEHDGAGVVELVHPGVNICPKKSETVYLQIWVF